MELSFEHWSSVGYPVAVKFATTKKSFIDIKQFHLVSKLTFTAVHARTLWTAVTWIVAIEISRKHDLF